jgi:hypothetical protein
MADESYGLRLARSRSRRRGAAWSARTAQLHRPGIPRRLVISDSFNQNYPCAKITGTVAFAWKAWNSKLATRGSMAGIPGRGCGER